MDESVLQALITLGGIIISTAGVTAGFLIWLDRRDDRRNKETEVALEKRDAAIEKVIEDTGKAISKVTGDSRDAVQAVAGSILDRFEDHRNEIAGLFGEREKQSNLRFDEMGRRIDGLGQDFRDLRNRVDYVRNGRAEPTNRI